MLECLNEAGVRDYHLQRLGIPDTFVEHGPQDLLRSKYGIDASALVKSACELLSHEPEKTAARS